MSILIFLIVLYILNCFTLQKVFEKAGIAASKAWIPGVNIVEWCKIIGRPGWNAIYMLLPIYNIFFYAGICVDLVRSFGKYDFWHSAVAVIFAPFMFWNIGKDDKTKFVAPAFTAEADMQEKIMEAQKSNDKKALHQLMSKNPYEKSQLREWVEAVVFAVFAAAFIRMFLIEAYVIPTSSMEGSLLVGDFLFVSKAHYGIRTPQTVAQIPLLHNRLPYIEAESYLDNPSLPYFRLPKIQEIQRLEPVVFNYPEGDSVFIRPERTYGIYDLRRQGVFSTPQGRKLMEKMVVRPMDKMDFYIKRCVAIAGDSIKIVDKQLYVNGVASVNPSQMHWEYKVTSNSGKINTNKLDDIGVNVTDAQRHEEGHYMLTQEQVAKIKTWGNDIKIDLVPHTSEEVSGYIFPHDTTYHWSVDNFGPLFIPKAGVTIPLTKENMTIYRRTISVYEHNKLEEKNDKIYINDVESTSYTFKLNYYWMMGDNRHNSEDSRFWGFVPETHIVGKPLFIWFSTKNANIANGIRWNRIFTTANKM